MAKSGKKRPDYMIGVLNKETDERGIVGAGWINEDGSIAIKLNPCVTLVGAPHLAIRLFKEDGRQERQERQRQPRQSFREPEENFGPPPDEQAF